MPKVGLFVVIVLPTRSCSASRSPRVVAPSASGGRRRPSAQDIVEEFRANEGKVGGPFAGFPLLLLHHRGAKTGTERKTSRQIPVVVLEPTQAGSSSSTS